MLYFTAILLIWKNIAICHAPSLFFIPSFVFSSRVVLSTQSLTSNCSFLSILAADFFIARVKDEEVKRSERRQEIIKAVQMLYAENKSYVKDSE